MKLFNLGILLWEAPVPVQVSVTSVVHECTKECTVTVIVTNREKRRVSVLF